MIVVLYYAYIQAAAEEIEATPVNNQVGMMLLLLPSFQAQLKEFMDKDKWDLIAPAILPDRELEALLNVCVPINKQCQPYVPEKGEFLGKHILETRFKNFEVPLPTESKKNVGFEANFQKIPDSLKARYAEWEKQVLQEFPQSKPAVLQGCLRWFFLEKQGFL